MGNCTSTTKNPPANMDVNIRRRRLSVSAVEDQQGALNPADRTQPPDSAESAGSAESSGPLEQAEPPKSGQALAPPVIVPKQARRRTDHGTSLEMAVAEATRMQPPKVKVPNKFAGGKKSLLSKFKPVVHRPIPEEKVAPSYLKKFKNIDAVLSTGAADQKEVSVGMVAGLIKNASESILVFGDPSDLDQRGFDHKKLATAGTLASEDLSVLEELGIGYACKKGFKPESPNQDDFFIISIDDWKLLGVFDGHGPYGHDVSSFVHRTLPFLLMSDPLWEQDPLDVLKRGFLKVHQLLESSCAVHQEFDCSLSGCTATVVLIRDRCLYIAHVGDSRAVLGTRMKQPNERHMDVTDLTVDHKPTLPEEKERIETHGGEVRRLQGDIPHRVFIRGRLYPGLAMSRAIGDTVGNMVGLTAEPEIKKYELGERDEYLIIATDGVWEFISSQEAVDFVHSKAKGGSLQNAADRKSVV